MLASTQQKPRITPIEKSRRRARFSFQKVPLDQIKAYDFDERTRGNIAFRRASCKLLYTRDDLERNKTSACAA
jgi:hypothetical protein